MLNIDAVRRIASQWNRAIVEPGGWDAAVGETARALGSPSAALFTPVVDRQQRLLTATYGAARASLSEYAAHWGERDPWFVRMQERGVRHVVGTGNLGRAVLSPSELDRTAFYQEFGRHYGVRDVLSMVICDESDADLPELRLSLHRPANRAEFDSNECRLIEQLWPHMKASVSAYWLLHGARRAHGPVDLALDAVPHPAWVLRSDGRVDHANIVARRLQSSSPWIICAGERLVSIGDLDSTTLVTALRQLPVRRATMTAGCEIGGRLRCVRVHFVPIAEHPSYTAAWPHSTALLLLDLPFGDRAEWIRAFARHHRLTRTEARVLGGVAAGDDLPAIAARLGVAHSTVRTHMRVLLEKTGCRRQSDLVRLLLEP